MPTWFGYGAHGVQFVPEWPGPGRFENLNNIPWTDVLGYRRGWGVRYRGKASSDNWFHCPIPTLELYQHASGRLGEIQVEFETFGTAIVDRVHVWSGGNRIFVKDGLTLTGKQSFADPLLDLQLNGGINVCVHVIFGSATSEILFTRAYARFVTP